MGTSPALRVRIFFSSMSAQMTSLPESANPVPATNPTYPVPMMAIFMTQTLSESAHARLVAVARLVGLSAARQYSTESVRTPEPSRPAKLRHGCDNDPLQQIAARRSQARLRAFGRDVHLRKEALDDRSRGEERPLDPPEGSARFEQLEVGRPGVGAGGRRCSAKKLAKVDE